MCKRVVHTGKLQYPLRAVRMISSEAETHKDSRRLKVVHRCSDTEIPQAKTAVQRGGHLVSSPFSQGNYKFQQVGLFQHLISTFC